LSDIIAVSEAEKNAEKARQMIKARINSPSGMLSTIAP